MPRINISVDLSNNDILPQEIEKAIDAAVKSKTREFFNKTLEEELTRIANNTANAWKYRSSWSPNPNHLEKAIKEQINAQITEQIGKIEVSGYDLKNAIDDKLNKIDNTISSCVAQRLEKVSFEEHIAKLVEKEVQHALPVKVLELMVRGVSGNPESKNKKEINV